MLCYILKTLPVVLSRQYFYITIHVVTIDPKPKWIMAHDFIKKSLSLINKPFNFQWYNMKKSIWYTIQVPLEGNWQLLTEWFLRGRCVNHVNTRVNTDPRKRIRTIMTTIRSCPNLYHFSQDIIVCNFGTARPIDLIQKPKCKFWRGRYHI